jgi:CRISP-associated protein Cas1
VFRFSIPSGVAVSANWRRAKRGRGSRQPIALVWQAETRSNHRKRMEFCNALIAKKIEGCIQTLETALRQSYAWDRAMKRARDDFARLANDPPETVDELRLLEARSAVAYFRAWYATSLLWRASARHPIPDEWRTVGPRFTRVYASGSPTPRIRSTPS